MSANVTLAIQARHHEIAHRHLFPGDGKEAAAILLCATCEGSRRRLLVRDILLVPHNECVRTAVHVTWPGEWIEKAIERAESDGLTIVLLHSHPGDYFDFSDVDDHSDRSTMVSMLEAFGREHGSAVMVPSGAMIARLYKRDLQATPIDLVTMGGDEIHFWWHPESIGRGRRAPPMAFTSAMTKDLGLLTAVLIGVSGTGSIVGEQLLRTGFGRVIAIEFDRVEGKNLNRILNTTLEDAQLKRLKVEVYAKAATRHRHDCVVSQMPMSVVTREAVLAASEGDVVFCCVDTYDARLIADRIAAAFLMPLFDMGVAIPTRKVGKNSTAIADVCGRIDYVYPGGSTLADRGVYTPEALAAEALQRSDPNAFAEQLAAGYFRGFGEQAPSVISLNMRAACQAFNEFLARTYPFRQEPNEKYAQSRFSLAANDEAHMAESEFLRDENPVLGRGLQEPLLNMLDLAEIRI
jgi:hypothetical protein